MYHQPHPGVDSNDALYGLAPDYTAQLKAKAQELLQQALADLSSDAATADSKVCAPFSLLLDGVCVLHALGHEPTCRDLSHLCIPVLQQTRQAELALELANRLAVTTKPTALLGRLMDLAAPLKATPYYRCADCISTEAEDLYQSTTDSAHFFPFARALPSSCTDPPRLSWFV